MFVFFFNSYVLFVFTSLVLFFFYQFCLSPVLPVKSCLSLSKERLIGELFKAPFMLFPLKLSVFSCSGNNCNEQNNSFWMLTQKYNLSIISFCMLTQKYNLSIISFCMLTQKYNLSIISFCMLTQKYNCLLFLFVC